MAGTRPLSGFDAASQKTLRSGGTVRGGDGRVFKLVNGVPTSQVVAPTSTSSSGVLTPAQIAAIANAPRPGAAAPTAPAAPWKNPWEAPGASSTQEPWKNPWEALPTSGTTMSGAPTSVAPGQPGGAAGTPEDPARASAQRDAYARLLSVLQEYGLEGLSGNLTEWLQQDLSDAEVIQRLRDTDAYKTRFSGMEERKRRGLAPISEAEYIGYERSAGEMFSRAGLPPGFYDSRDDFTKFIGQNISLAELGDRVGLASEAAFNSDESVRGALSAFGMTGGDLTAFFLDPDTATPLLERKYRSARLSAAGNRTGFGFLDEQEATGLVQLGVTEGQATQGLAELKTGEELFTAMDRGEDNISRSEQLGATFKGDAVSRRKIAQRTRRRQATFEQGGGFAAGQGGVSGLGSSQT